MPLKLNPLSLTLTLTLIGLCGLAGRDCLEFSDFEAAVEQYPELMTTALDIIERGRSQAMGAEECC